MSDFNIGDDVTVSGIITFKKDGYLEIETPNHDSIWIKESDVKTHRPKKKGIEQKFEKGEIT